MYIFPYQIPLLTFSMPPHSLAHLGRVQTCIQIVPLLGENGCFVVTLTFGEEKYKKVS
jgi:hypothetical protein